MRRCGAGGGYFYSSYPKYVMEYFPEAINIVEVKNAIYNNYEITSRNLFVRFFAENGIFVGSIFLVYLYNIWKKNHDNHSIMKLFVYAVACMLFQDSLCCEPVLFILALCTVNMEKKDGQGLCCYNYV